MPIKYPTEFKVKAIRRYEKGESIKELCKELNISQSTLYHWRKQYCSIQTDTRTYTPAEFDAISRRLRKVEHELEVIRLSGYIARIPLQDKLATLEHLHNEMADLYSVHELCEALDVSRGTFYNHIFRRVDRSKYEEEKAQLMLKIKQIFDDSEQRYGANKIRTVLVKNGMHVSTKRGHRRTYRTPGRGKCPHWTFPGLPPVRLIQHPHRCKKAIQNSTAAQKTKPAKP